MGQNTRLDALLDRAEEVSARFWPEAQVRGPDECWPWRAGSRRSGTG